MSQGWLWSFVVLAVGTALWFARWSREPKGLPVTAYLLAAAILIWSAIWHAVMALGGAHTKVGDHDVHWGHYADWIVTAPLLGYSLVLTGTYALASKRLDLVAVLTVASVPMIVCGTLADLAHEPTTRYTVYGVGVGVVNLVVIWGPLRMTAARQPAPMAAHFILVARLLTALWLGFTLVWLLGPSGLGILDELTTTVVFVVLSALMKVAWSAVDLGRLRLLADRDQLLVA
ncbi:bacteriorhodopsin [Micromonospora sp. Llam0]|uniref:bacteriorhodopsin n=1 Tax=Micromonospora sp. Llam0 TaxID=2485143 RepID=UPI000F9343D6|nr:bacteriorhodopsin [Micromonospora sp. Llam0]ROO51718.1 bacteriorhodopsin [Micromonospora sp. Llam0]